MLYDDDHVARMVIAEVYAEDQGEYRIQATNESGSAKSSCDVKVISKSKFLAQLKPYITQGLRNHHKLLL